MSGLMACSGCLAGDLVVEAMEVRGVWKRRMRPGSQVPQSGRDQRVRYGCAAGGGSLVEDDVFDRRGDGSRVPQRLAQVSLVALDRQEVMATATADPLGGAHLGAPRRQRSPPHRPGRRGSSSSLSAGVSLDLLATRRWGGAAPVVFPGGQHVRCRRIALAGAAHDLADAPRSPSVP